MTDPASSTDFDSPALMPGTADVWRRHYPSLDIDRARQRLMAGSLRTAISGGAILGSRSFVEIAGKLLEHRQLIYNVRRAAGWLRSNRVQPGDRVLVSGRNSLDLVTAYLASLFAGAVVIPVDPGSTADELLALAEASGASAACAEADGLQVLADADRVTCHVELATGERRTAAPTVSDAVAKGRLLRASHVDGEAVAMLAFTSGTTGSPRGVPLTHANLLSSIRAAIWAWRFRPDDVLVHALPLSHQHGLSGLHASLITSSSVVILDGFDPAQLCSAVKRRRGTVLFAVPAMYERLRDCSRSELAPLRCLRLPVSGSAPLSPRLTRELEEMLGQRPLERYGSTETGLSVSNLYDGPRHIGGVGFALPGLELAVATADGASVTAGDEGEIVLRGPQVTKGYYRDPKSTTAASLGSGWFRTGDLGVLDPEGRLTITGRLKELIISGGLNVSPREVELVLEDHDAIAEAAVVGVPSERWGEMVVAAVTARPGAAIVEDAILAFARNRLAPHKRPKQVVVVDELPTNRLGKVQRRRVLELMQAQAAENSEHRRSL